MRICKGCTSAIGDEALFCPICGCKQEQERKISNVFCTHCGAVLHPQAKQCERCGTLNTAIQTQAIFQKVTPEVIKNLSTRVTVVAIIWLCIALCQLVVALLSAFLYVFIEQDAGYIWAAMVYGIFGALNIWNSIKGMQKTTKYKTDFVGIVQEYKVTTAIWDWLYNGYVVYVSLLSTGWMNRMLGVLILIAIIVELIFVYIWFNINKKKFIQLERAQTNYRE